MDQLKDIKMINELNIDALSYEFKNNKPFNHVIIDNFWKKDIADEIVKDYDIITSDEKNFYVYDNPIEKKLVVNHWDKFPKTTYTAFSYLNSLEFLNILEKITNIDNLKTDVGLHGGGCHVHPKGGKLNIHLDYSIHPKLKLERKLNIIIYMTPNWMSGWGGNLQLWSHDDINNSPKKCEKAIDIKFNRAVIFDTTQNSWHGLPDELNLPNGIKRQSMAVYYLVDPKKDSSPRQRALYAPYKEQKEDPKILDLIQKRSTEICNTVYRV